MKEVLFAANSRRRKTSFLCGCAARPILLHIPAEHRARLASILEHAAVRCAGRLPSVMYPDGFGPLVGFLRGVVEQLRQRDQPRHRRGLRASSGRSTAMPPMSAEQLEPPEPEAAGPETAEEPRGETEFWISALVAFVQRFPADNLDISDGPDGQGCRAAG